MPALILSDSREYAISYQESCSLEEDGLAVACEECTRGSRVRIFHEVDQDPQLIADILRRISERVYPHDDKTFNPDNQEEL